jgi:hypothetical protein
MLLQNTQELTKQNINFGDRLAYALTRLFSGHLSLFELYDYNPI